MLISVRQLTKFWNIQPKSVLHVGAHEAEEFDEYISNRWGPVTWIEAQPDKIKFLKAKLQNTNHSVLQGVVWDKSGVARKLKVTSNSQSTSILSLGTHQDLYPSIVIEKELSVKTITLDELVKNKKFEFLSLDIQGAELYALKGFTKGLKNVRWVYCEVNKAHLYEGCSLIQEIDEYLSTHDFKRVATRWTEYFWGDALYISNNFDHHLSIFNRIRWSIIQISFILFSAFRSRVKKWRDTLLK